MSAAAGHGSPMISTGPRSALTKTVGWILQIRSANGGTFFHPKCFPLAEVFCTIRGFLFSEESAVIGGTDL